MVFSSAPLYLDPPDWSQYQQAQQHGSGNGIGGGSGSGGGGGAHEVHQLTQGQTPPRPDGGMQVMVRPTSMADRARLAKLPQPEQALKCPRCDSLNTKFCYFNNYSLSQPRHFCKTCRRYWTRGGALRNIPVGGGCRRNKRSKSAGSGTPSKSQTSTDLASSSTSTMVTNSSLPLIHSASQLPFMASLHMQPLSTTGGDYTSTNIGLNFAGLTQPIDAENYQVGSLSSSVGMEQWRIQQIQQFPFFGGLENSGQQPVHGLYSFHGDHQGGSVASSAGLISQMASVKMEDSSQGLNLGGQYLSAQRNDQYNWSRGGNAGGDGGNNGGSGGGGWMTNLSGFNPSTSGNIL